MNAGLGPVLVPLSGVLTGSTGALPPHITAALQSLAPGGAAFPQQATPFPSLPTQTIPAAIPSQQMSFLQQVAASQMLQQATAAAQQPPSSHVAEPRAVQAAPSSVAEIAPAVTGAVPSLVPSVIRAIASSAPASASLAALVPHVPQMTPPVNPAVVAAVAAAVAAKSETTSIAPGTMLLA